MGTRLFVCCIIALISCIEPALSYPDKPIKLIVPYTAGTSTAEGARIIAKKMSELLGQQIIIDYRPGAIGQIGTQALTRAEPDGYTVGFLADGQVVTMPAALHVAHKEPLYDPERGLTPIGFVADSYFIFTVRRSLDVGTIEEMLQLFAKEGSRISLGSGNPTGTLGLALLNSVLQKSGASPAVEIRYWAAGEPRAYIDMQGGFIDGMMSTTYTALPHLEAGSVKALGVLGKQRSPLLPFIPTLREQGLREFGELETWYGLFGPSNLPSEVLNILNRTLNEALSDAEVEARLVQMGTSPRASSPEQFSLAIEKQYKKMQLFLKENKVILVGD